MGDISICAENCGGQNKNCIVVWFIIWIIETGFFPKVTLIFYVLVYAKNVSDRLFNILKGGVKKSCTYPPRYGSSIEFSLIIQGKNHEANKFSLL